MVQTDCKRLTLQLLWSNKERSDMMANYRESLVADLPKIRA